jgi:hypothetical protein
MAKINKEQAEKEVISWLEYKGYDEEEIEAQQPLIESFAALVSKGTFSINTEDFTIKQKLRFPIKEVESGATITDTLEFKPRVQMKDINNRMARLKEKQKDEDVKTRVGVCASVVPNWQPTGIPVDEIIGRLDPIDYRSSTFIGVFSIV